MMKMQMNFGAMEASFGTDGPEGRYAGDTYLARYAECMFWMSRYLKRAEDLARLLEVTQTFTPASQGAQNWESILALHLDQENFAARYSKADAASVIRFYLTDESHPNSIHSCVRAARSNASQLRAVISTEMWVQVNILYNNVRGLGERTVTPQDLSGVLSAVRLQCQAHAGITQSNLYHDQGWYFYLIGRDIERADHTTRLLDIKYHLLLPSPDAVGSLIDESQWFALLRAASGYHAFRRGSAMAVTPATVAAFLLLDRRFPLSVLACIGEVSYALSKLERHYGLLLPESALTASAALAVHMRASTIEQIIAGGLHEYLDHIQGELAAMADSIARSFF